MPSVSTAATPLDRASGSIPPCPRVADDDLRLGIADEIVELGQGIGGVERQVDGAGPDAGQIEHDRFGALFRLDRHAVARLDAALDQQVGDPAGKVHGVAIGEDAAASGSMNVRSAAGMWLRISAKR